MATIEGIGSARQLDRVCERDARYRWICGGVSLGSGRTKPFFPAAASPFTNLGPDRESTIVDPDPPAKGVVNICGDQDTNLVDLGRCAGTHPARPPSERSCLSENADRGAGPHL